MTTRSSRTIRIALPLEETLELLGKRYIGAIIRLLAADACDVQELAAAIDAQRSSMSRHLRELRDAGLVAYRREKNRHVYALSQRCARNTRDGRTHIEITTKDNCVLRLSLPQEQR